SWSSLPTETIPCFRAGSAFGAARLSGARGASSGPRKLREPRGELSGPWGRPHPESRIPNPAPLRPHPSPLIPHPSPRGRRSRNPAAEAPAGPAAQWAGAARRRGRGRGRHFLALQPPAARRQPGPGAAAPAARPPPAPPPPCPLTSGVSVCCCLFILFLFLSELTGFIATEIVNELYVDDPDKDSGGKIEVNLNISLPNLHCELVGLDIQDEMGRHEVGHIDNSMKIPLNNGDGCRFEGHFSINKVPGNFHVSTHSATAQPQNPDMTHVIHKLSFGDKLQVHNVHGAFNALEGADKLSSNPLASHDYILKIVPTVYEDMSGKQRYSYQYTVANKEYVAYSHTGRIIPAIWFRYDLSPITVKYTERRQPLYRFITSICAIIGGTFTVAGILDSCIFTASEAWKKIQLGKMQ
uniref:Endoplasmic reticulum-Golgi intermediate compartment protein n=1 Tax=Corvus moneduloides TaxID=1196302 RepID=A0A8C3DNN3_CORMO